MNTTSLLKGAERILDPHEILARPLDSLIGVTSEASQALKGFGITTIQDLANASMFALANTLANANAALTDPSSAGRLANRIPLDLLDPRARIVPIEKLAHQPLSLLKFPPRQIEQLTSKLGVTTLGDLAKWPPFQTAKDIADLAAGSLKPVSTEDPEAPSYLIPAAGQHPTERVRYNVIVLDRVLNDDIPHPATQPLEHNFQPLDVSQHSDAGFSRPALGAVLSYTQSWYTLGLSLGHLLHSVALAPGETTRVAIVDWSRRERGSQSEDTNQSESLSASLEHNRAIGEVTSAVATEAQTGFSQFHGEEQAYSVGGGSGAAGQMGSIGSFTGAYSLGGSGGKTDAFSFSATTGRREVSAEMTQTINDSTHQAANAVRNRRASVVREVSQNESETISTRALTNFNHMHALTIQYYEVVQLYRTVVQLNQATRCLLLPMKVLDFSRADVVQRYSASLAAAALTPDAAAALLGYRSRPVKVTLSGSSDDQPEWLSKAQSDSGLSLSDSSPELWQLPPETQLLEWRITSTDSECGNILDSITIQWQDGTQQTGHVPISGGNERKFGPGWTCKGYECWGNPAGLLLSSCHSMLLIGKSAKEARLQIKFALAYRGRTFTYQHTALLPANAASLTAVTIQPISEGVDSHKLPNHLQENALYYSQAVWMKMNGPSLISMLDGYTFQGHPLADLLDPQPLATIGNYLAFRFYQEDEQWTRFLRDHGIKLGTKQEDIIPLPSGGVFAEAVLGRFNSAEKLDITRFWNWQDSPIPITAPEIAPLTAASRAQAANLEAGQLAQPVINLVNAPALPDPTGLSAALTAVANGAMFRDMSNTAETIAAAREALSAGFAASSQSQETATRYSEQAAQLAAKLGAGTRQSSSGPTSPRTISNAGARINYGEKLDRQNASNGVGTNTSNSGTSPSSNGSTASAGKAATNNASYTGAAFESDLGTYSQAGELSSSTSTEESPSTEKDKDFFEYSVPGIVPIIGQTSNNTCWAAVASMLISWRDNTSYSIEEAMNLVGESYREKFDQDQGLSKEEKAAFLQVLGLEAAPPMNYSPRGLLNLLKQHGPIWITTDEDTSQQFSIHARILTGIAGNETKNGTMLSIIDPAYGGQQYEESYAEFGQKFEEEALSSNATTALRIQVAYFSTTANSASEGNPAAAGVAAVLGGEALKFVGSLGEKLVDKAFQNATLSVSGPVNVALLLASYPHPDDYYSMTTQPGEFSTTIAMHNLLGNGPLEGLNGTIEMSWDDNCTLHNDKLGNGRKARALRSIHCKKALTCYPQLMPGRNIESASIEIIPINRGIEFRRIPVRPVVDLRIMISIVPKTGQSRIGTLRIKNILDPEHIAAYTIMENSDPLTEKTVAFNVVQVALDDPDQ